MVIDNLKLYLSTFTIDRKATNICIRKSISSKLPGAIIIIVNAKLSFVLGALVCFDRVTLIIIDEFYSNYTLR